MSKKILCALFCLMLLSLPALADGAVVLSGDAVVDGSVIYYSGSIDSAETGVYRINADGSGVSRLNDSIMTLLCASDGNLMGISYDEGDYEYALVILNAMGEKTVLHEGYIDHAIAADGRFYWGVGSCATDGSDKRILIDDPDHSYNYYPLAVRDGWYYYLDWAENSDSVFFEGTSSPIGARLCRYNLETAATDVISGYGATFLGLDDEYVYFSRDNYWLYDAETYDTYEVEVNSGVYRANLATLAIDQLAAFPDGDSALMLYQLMSDGIIYGVSYNYGDTGMICEIVRMTTDGTQLPSFSLDNQTLTIHCLADGVLYASVCNVEYSDDDYIQRDLLYAINVSDGSFTLINTSASDLFYYSESEPAIRVSDGRIYMIVDDTEACALSLKSCATDGSDWITLARGISLAIG